MSVLSALLKKPAVKAMPKIEVPGMPKGGMSLPPVLGRTAGLQKQSMMPTTTPELPQSPLLRRMMGKK